MISLKIGESCKTGDLIKLSRKGNICRVKKFGENPIGIALHPLRKGRFAYECGRGQWQEVGAVDIMITKITCAYFPDDFIKEELLPEIKKPRRKL